MKNNMKDYIYILKVYGKEYNKVKEAISLINDTFRDEVLIDDGSYEFNQGYFVREIVLTKDYYDIHLFDIEDILDFNTFDILFSFSIANKDLDLLYSSDQCLNMFKSEITYITIRFDGFETRFRSKEKLIKELIDDNFNNKSRFTNGFDFYTLQSIHQNNICDFIEYLNDHLSFLKIRAIDNRLEYYFGV